MFEMKTLSKVNTEGKFEFRIKPIIEHALKFINRSVEELQKRVLVLENDNKRANAKIKYLIKILEERGIK